MYGSTWKITTGIEFLPATFKVADGFIDGGGVEKCRLKIWNKASGVVVYENQMGEPDDAPSTAVLDGGQIVIHSP